MFTILTLVVCYGCAFKQVLRMIFPTDGRGGEGRGGALPVFYWSKPGNLNEKPRGRYLTKTMEIANDDI